MRNTVPKDIVGLIFSLPKTIKFLCPFSHICAGIDGMMNDGDVFFILFITKSLSKIQHTFYSFDTPLTYDNICLGIAER